MSEFDAFEAAHASDLVARLGAEDAVEIGPPTARQKYPAIVGRLRVETLLLTQGNQEREEHQETCRIEINCPPGVVGVRDKLWASRHGSDRAESYDAERFTVTTVEGQTETWTTVVAVRRPLARVLQRGAEARG